MTKIVSYIENTTIKDENFIGTIAFRNEELTLPDGSKMALGIDDGHWVLVYQKEAKAAFRFFEYDRREKKVTVDKKPGTGEEIAQFKKLVGYMFTNTNVEDLVTLLPPQVVDK